MPRTTAGLIVLVTLGILGASCAGAQTRQVVRLGLLDYTPSWEPFLQGLRELGYREGENLLLEYRLTEGRRERLPELAAELVRLPVDVLVTLGVVATRAAQDATTTIPIVMVAVGDPLRTGIVASLAHPGGNVTGSTTLGAELSAKRLQLLYEAIPTLAHVAFLWNPANSANRLQFEEIARGAKALGVTLHSVEVSHPDGFDRAFAALRRDHPDALIMTADAMHQQYVERVMAFAAQHRLPALYQLRENVEAGGLMSYGASEPELFRRGALYVDKILKGAKPADLPVEQPMKFELVINLKTAQALGLTIPPTFLFQADEVIQ
jgi:putative tryptophan/tyrosine transport system substrate-binding protein